MRAAVDTLLVIKNDRLREMHGNLSLKNAFEQADNILANAAKGIAELISVTGAINVDMNDVNTVMKDSGVAIMGQATAEGEDRAIKAARKALESPLLNDNDIEGAQYILLNITYGSSEVMMDEISDITDYIQHAAGSSADVIWGHGLDESLGEKLSVTIIATGFKSAPDTGFELDEPVRMNLNTDSEPKKSRAIQSEMETPTGDKTGEPYLKEVSEKELEEKQKETEEKPMQRFDLFGNEAPQQQEKDTKEDESEEQKDVQTEAEPKTDKSENEYFTLDAKESATSEKQSTDNADESDEITHRVNVEVANQLNRERLRNLREISERIKSPQGLTELEKEPAYKRRNVRLDRLAHSSDSDVSRYTLSEERDENGNTRSGLRPNNPYLHDNVD